VLSALIVWISGLMTDSSMASACVVEELVGRMGMRKISEEEEAESSDWGKMKASIWGDGAGGEV